MAAISLSLARGVDGFAISDFTVGTLAPNANDFELRFNTTDGEGNPILMIDLVQALRAFLNQAESTGDMVVFTPPTE